MTIDETLSRFGNAKSELIDAAAALMDAIITAPKTSELRRQALNVADDLDMQVLALHAVSKTIRDRDIRLGFGDRKKLN